MPRYRHALPQLAGELFLTDGGVETDLIFNQGIEVREFACFTLLLEPVGRAALARYFDGFLALARELDVGFVLDSATWKAHTHWSASLKMSAAEFRAVNEDSIRFIAELRERHGNPKPVVLNAVIGPRGDAYAPDRVIPLEDAEAYFAEQLGWLAETEVDMVSALTIVNEQPLTIAAVGTYVIGRLARSRTAADVGLHWTESLLATQLVTSTLRVASVRRCSSVRISRSICAVIAHLPLR